MAQNDSIEFSQQLPNCPTPEANESNLCLYSIFEVHFNIIILCRPSFEVVSFRQLF